MAAAVSIPPPALDPLVERADGLRAVACFMDFGGAFEDRMIASPVFAAAVREARAIKHDRPALLALWDAAAALLPPKSAPVLAEPTPSPPLVGISLSRRSRRRATEEYSREAEMEERAGQVLAWADEEG